MVVIELVQGDVSKVFKFQRKLEDGEVITTIPQKMWITFKRSCSCESCLFQKKLEDETIKYSSEDNYYRFQILSEDTCDLSYGKYGFDIAIIDEAGNKRTLLNDGVLEIVKHYTKKCNEV
jgi:hypothetical protein